MKNLYWLAGIDREDVSSVPRLHTCMYSFLKQLYIHGDKRYRESPFPVDHCSRCGTYRYNDYEASNLGEIRKYLKKIQKERHLRNR